MRRVRTPSPIEQRLRRQRWHDARAALCVATIVGLVFWKVPVQTAPYPAAQAIVNALQATTAP